MSQDENYLLVKCQEPDVESINGKKSGMIMKNDPRRRTALHLAAQLPEDVNDALKVLEYAKELVEKYLSPDQPTSRRAADDASRCAISTLKVLSRPE